MHVGFASAWAEVSTTVLAGVAASRAAYPTYRVISVGHSLGGALATLAGAYMREAGHPVDIYTYGAPRVGNSVFATFVTETQAGNEYRVTHTDDPVPKLPPMTTGYRHLSPEYWITNEEVEVSAADVQVCNGYATLECNAGTMSANQTAHVWYFGHTSGCGSDTWVMPLK